MMILKQSCVLKALNLVARSKKTRSGELCIFIKFTAGRRLNHTETGKLPVSSKNYVSCDQKSILFLRNSPRYRNSTYQEDSTLLSCLDVEPKSEISAIVSSPEFHFDLVKNKFPPDTFLKLFYCISSNKKLFSHWPTILNYGRKQIHKLNDQQLLILMFISVKYSLHYDDMFLKKLDKECTKFISAWNKANCLLVLDLWFILSCGQMIRGAYMMSLLQAWDPKLNICSPHHIVQLLFYIGFKTNCSHEHLRKIENVLDKSVTCLNDEEIKILCGAFFKNKYKLSSEKLLKKISLTTRTVLNAEHTDTIDLIRLCKSLRFSKHFDPAVNAQLIYQLKSGLLHKLSLIESAHLLATLANMRIYDKDLYSLLENHVALLLEEENVAIKNKTCPKYLCKIRVPNQFRSKDIARLLWIFAESAHSIKNAGFFKNVLENISLSYERDLFNDYPHYLLDCLVSLAVLGHFPKDLIHVALSPEFVKKLKG